MAESYPFTPDSRFVLTFDNHNSVNGMRNLRRAGHRSTTCRSPAPALRLDLAGMRAPRSPRIGRPATICWPFRPSQLFRRAAPAQSR
ncbi:MAG: hypothetical protein R3A10_08930 [Caldilineaceae bacterium]